MDQREANWLIGYKYHYGPKRREAWEQRQALYFRTHRRVCAKCGDEYSPRGPNHIRLFHVRYGQCPLGNEPDDYRIALFGGAAARSVAWRGYSTARSPRSWPSLWLPDLWPVPTGNESSAPKGRRVLCG